MNEPINFPVVKCAAYESGISFECKKFLIPFKAASEDNSRETQYKKKPPSFKIKVTENSPLPYVIKSTTGNERFGWKTRKAEYAEQQVKPEKRKYKALLFIASSDHIGNSA